MSWYKDGVWNGLGVWEIKYILAELCYAVNEREKLLGCGIASDTWTPWYEAGGGYNYLSGWDGPDGTIYFPSASDFNHMLITDALSQNVPLLRAAILKLGLGLDWPDIGYRMHDFDQSISYQSGYHAVYVPEPTKDSLYGFDDNVIDTDTYGHSWVPAPGTSVPIEDVDAFIQLRLVLEKLKYVRYVLFGGLPGVRSGTDYLDASQRDLSAISYACRRWSGCASNLETAWANCLAEDEETLSDKIPGGMWEIEGVYDPDPPGFCAHNVLIVDSAEIPIASKYVKGTIEEAVSWVRHRKTDEEIHDLIRDLDVDIETDETRTYTIPPGELTVADVEINHSGWPSQNAHSKIIVTKTSANTPYPWDNGTDVYAEKMFASVGLGGVPPGHTIIVYVHTDVSGLLTYG
jgi:hypothetical protein